MGKGRGWDTGTLHRTWPAHMRSWASMQGLNSRHSLQSRFPPWENTQRSLLIRTWWKLHSSVGKTFLPNATNPAKELMWELLKSAARHARSEQAMDQALNRVRDQHGPHWNFSRSGKIQHFHYCNCSIVLFWPNKQIKCTFLLANSHRRDRDVKILFLEFTAAVTLTSKEAP